MSSEQVRSRDGLGSEHAEQCELLGVARARRGRVEHEVLVALGDGEGVAVDGDVAHASVAERLPQGWWGLDVVPLPEAGGGGAAAGEPVGGGCGGGGPGGGGGRAAGVGRSAPRGGA